MVAKSPLASMAAVAAAVVSSKESAVIIGSDASRHKIAQKAESVIRTSDFLKWNMWCLSSTSMSIKQ